MIRRSILPPTKFAFVLNPQAANTFGIKARQGWTCRLPGSAPQARRLVAGARHVFRVPAAVAVNALGRQFQYPIGQGGEEVPVV
jgi:hypothetical protein